jgi:hypothetical protein
LFPWKILFLILSIVYSVYYFSFYKKQINIENLSEFSNSDVIDFKMLLCISVFLIYILFEIISLNYRSITYYMDSKVTQKILPLRQELLPVSSPVKIEEKNIRPDFIKKFLEKRSIRLNLDQDLLTNKFEPPTMLNMRNNEADNFLFQKPGSKNNQFQITPKEVPERRSFNRFRDIALKVRILIKVLNIIKSKSTTAEMYSFNTSIKKYLSGFFLLTSIFSIVYVWEPSFDEDLKRYSFQYLIKYPLQWNGRVIIFFVALYIAFDCFEINRYRKTNYTSILNQNFKSVVNKILFKISLAVPFFVEIKTVLNFISNKTSIDIFKWYKIEDIKRILISAKFINISQKKKIVGYEEPRTTKFIFSYVFFIVFFFILTAPFWLFSNLNPLVGAPKISTVNFKIFLSQEQNNFKTSNYLILSEINLFDFDDLDTQQKDKLSKIRNFTDEEFVKIKVY